MTGYLKKWPLTPSQRRGVEQTGQRTVVTAGAGTGKTGVLTKRFAHLVLSGQGAMDQILAITFTEKAAAEMSLRVAELFEEEGRGDLRRKLPEASISTIHSFCARLLQENAIEAGIDPSHNIVNELEQEYLVSLAMDQTLLNIQTLSKAQYENFLASIKTDGRFGADIRTAIRNIYNHIRVGRTTITEAFQILNPSDRANRIIDKLRELIPAYLSAARRRPKQSKTMMANENAVNIISLALDQPDPIRRIMALKEQSINLNIGRDIKETAREIKELSLELIHVSAEVFAFPIRGLLADLVQAFSDNYRKIKEERSLLDFSDLEQLTLDFLEGNPERAKKIRQRYKFVMVDEFQDVNPLQAKLISLVSKENNLFIVGDHKQSIYGFRQADVTVFKNEVKREGAVKISLSTNFRSSKQIIDFVNLYFQAQWTGQQADLGYEPIEAHIDDSQPPSDNKPAVEFLYTPAKAGSDIREFEAKSLVKRVKNLIDGEGGEFAPGDITILFRSRTHIAPFLSELIKNHVPFQEVKGSGFFKREEIIDLQNYLGIIANSLDDLAMAAVLKSPFVNLDNSTLLLLCDQAKDIDGSLFKSCLDAKNNENISTDSKEKLGRFFDAYQKISKEVQALSLDELARIIYTKTGYRDWALAQPDGARKVANIELCVNMALGFSKIHGPTPLGLSKAIKGFRERNTSLFDFPTGKSGDAVTLMTIHSAKGLESPVIFIADCNHGAGNKSSPITFHRKVGVGFNVYLPDFTSVGAITRNKGMEIIKREEREEDLRLFYVAMTRAKKRLVFSCAFKPDVNGRIRVYSWAKNLLDFFELDQNKMEDWKGIISPSKNTFVSIINGEKLPVLTLGNQEKARVEKESLLARFDSLPKTLKRPDGSKYLYTVSELTTFAKCPFRYYLIYVLGLPPGIIHDFEKVSFHVAGSDDKGDGLVENSDSAVNFGNAVHQMFAETKHDDVNWKDMAMEIGNSFFENAEETDKAIKRVENFYRNPRWNSICAHSEINKELPFLWKHNNRLVRGKIDLVVNTPKGYWLVDYKTNRAWKNGTSGIAGMYKLQMIYYFIAIKKLFGVAPYRASLFLTETDRFLDLTIDSESINQASDNIDAILKADAAGKYIKNERECSFCPDNIFCLKD